MMIEMDTIDVSTAGHVSTFDTHPRYGTEHEAGVDSRNTMDLESGCLREADSVEKSLQVAEPLSQKPNVWPVHYQERYPGSFMYHFNLTFVRQYKLTSRDTVFIKSRLGQCVLVGAIAGSLFSNLALTDVTTKAGFLFYVILFNAFSSFAMIPLCFDQKV